MQGPVHPMPCLMPNSMTHKLSCHFDANTESYAYLIYNSRPSFPSTCVAKLLVKRKIWMADNKCDLYVVHLKEESKKSVLLPGKHKEGMEDR
ncbi:hypothetical protein TNCV_3679771 [Trichonephila clavipes]|nr:hypothetical protein TNCV_3679771 [Trichonephila clavipes]